MKNEQLEKYLKILFNDDELIWSGNTYNVKKYPLSFQNTINKLQNLKPTNDGIFVGLNPAKSLISGLSIGEVLSCRNFLIEIDIVAGIEEQIRLIKLSQIPYSSLVFSGGKSVHVVVSLDEPWSDVLVSYKDVHEALCKKLSVFADKNTNSPACTTKAPGFFRINKDGISTEQYLIEIRGRIERDCLMDCIGDELSRLRMKARVANSPRKKSGSHGSSNARDLLSQYVYGLKGVSCVNSNVTVQCPLCELEGSDRSKNNLSIDLSGEKPLTCCHRDKYGHGFVEIIKHLKNK